MAAGAVPASFTGLKSKENGLGFGKSMNFVRVSDSQRVKFRRTKVSVIRNAIPDQETIELQSASEGSPLLGRHCQASSSLHVEQFGIQSILNFSFR